MTLEINMSLAGIDELFNSEDRAKFILARGITDACNYLEMREEVTAEYLGMPMKSQYRIFDELVLLVVEKRRKETTSAWLERWRLKRS